jgi:hypothetical protein
MKYIIPKAKYDNASRYDGIMANEPAKRRRKIPVTFPPVAFSDSSHDIQ